MTRIVVVSDIVKWGSYEKIIDKTKPDIVILAGDLTSDGFASFWNLKQTPEFKEKLRKSNIKITNTGTLSFYEWIDNKKAKGLNAGNILDVVEALRENYRKSREFLESRKITHVDKFYNFLEYTGKRAIVLVVKGDHDEDFVGDYNVEKINKTVGCHEISGKMVRVKNLNVLGLGYENTDKQASIDKIVENFTNKVDIVITHCQQKKLPILSQIKPKIVIRGHYGSGKYLVNSVPTVMTASVMYTIIEIDNKIKISQFSIGKNGNFIEVQNGTCRPMLSKRSEFELYSWLKPWPENM